MAWSRSVLAVALTLALAGRFWIPDGGRRGSGVGPFPGAGCGDVDAAAASVGAPAAGAGAGLVDEDGGAAGGGADLQPAGGGGHHHGHTPPRGAGDAAGQPGRLPGGANRPSRPAGVGAIQGLLPAPASRAFSSAMAAASSPASKTRRMRARSWCSSVTSRVRTVLGPSMRCRRRNAVAAAVSGSRSGGSWRESEGVAGSALSPPDA